MKKKVKKNLGINSIILQVIIYILQITGLLFLIGLLRITKTDYILELLHAAFILLVAISLILYSSYTLNKSYRVKKKKSEKLTAKFTIALFLILILGLFIIVSMFYDCSTLFSFPHVAIELCGKYGGCSCEEVNIWHLLISLLVTPVLFLSILFIRDKISKR